MLATDPMQPARCGHRPNAAAVLWNRWNHSVEAEIELCNALEIYWRARFKFLTSPASAWPSRPHSGKSKSLNGVPFAAEQVTR